MNTDTQYCWTPSQLQRLTELGAEKELLDSGFPTAKERDSCFLQIEKKWSKEGKKKLAETLSRGGKNQLDQLADSLTEMLTSEGFTRVSTPTIISAKALEKMTVDFNHPLHKQVFWLNQKQCLRPMLAPNLYSLMLDFSRRKQRPIRFFEIGSCFRKESAGSNHANEFTMMNLVEMGLPLEERIPRLKHLAKRVAETAGIMDCSFEEEESEVYGSTLDLVAGPAQIEVASGATGPHPLDAEWGIHESWAGMGFGLERLLMIGSGSSSIRRWCRSLNYHNGIHLRV